MLPYLELNQNTRFMALPDGRAGGLDYSAMVVRRLAKESNYWGIRTSNSTYPNNKNVDLFRLSTQYVPLSNHCMAHFVYGLEKHNRTILINFLRRCNLKIWSVKEMLSVKGYRAVIGSLWRKVKNSLSAGLII